MNNLINIKMYYYFIQKKKIKAYLKHIIIKPSPFFKHMGGFLSHIINSDWNLQQAFLLQETKDQNPILLYLFGLGNWLNCLEWSEGCRSLYV